MKHFTICFIFIVFFTLAKAQRNPVCLFGYASNVYKGDFKSKQGYGNSFFLSLNLNQKKKVSGNLSARIGSFSAQELHSKFSNEVVNYVKTNYLSVNYGLNISLYNYKKCFFVKCTPGIGFMRYAPKTFEGEKLINKSNTRKKNESYSNITLVLPIKFSIEYITKYKVVYEFTTGYLNPRTDYLDNVSELGVSNKKDNLFFMGLAVGVDL